MTPSLTAKARQNRLIAIRSLEARELNIFAESFGAPRLARPGQISAK